MAEVEVARTRMHYRVVCPTCLKTIALPRSRSKGPRAIRYQFCSEHQPRKAWNANDAPIDFDVSDRGN